MLSTLLSYLRRHHIGLLALFVAFSGVAYAAGGDGKTGKGAVSKLTVRKTTVSLSQTCQPNGFGGLICSGPLTKVTAKCRRGERAVGGGYSGTDEASTQVGGSARQGTPQNTSRPQPAKGTPRAWVATARSFGQSPTATPPAQAKFTVYAVCAT